MRILGLYKITLFIFSKKTVYVPYNTVLKNLSTDTGKQDVFVKYDAPNGVILGHGRVNLKAILLQ